MEHNDRFLADGFERAYSANEPIIRKQVEHEYADRLSQADPKERRRLRCEMESVIAERLDEVATAQRAVLTPMKTNVLRLKTCDGPYGDRSLVILIDGRDFIDIVRQAELNDDSEMAGKYAGPPVRVLSSRLFYGELPENVGWLSSATILGTVPILGCTCGTEGCWPLHVSITQTKDNFVTWSGFTNPFRKDWHYATIGTLRFKATDYADEIDSTVKRFGNGDDAT